jgi:hypothetical protein
MSSPTFVCTGDPLVCGKEFAYDWTQMKVIFEPKRTSEPAAESVPIKVHAA